jgi:5-methylthioadenosine/S-adenosylhomocysteine deaminase
MDPKVSDLAKGDILVVNGKIEAVGTELASAGPDTLELDCTDRIILPGFVDCHRHAWEGGLRSIHPNSSTFPQYMEVMQGFRKHMRPQDIYAGIYASAIAAIDGGITTVIDNMHANETPEHGKSAVAAWRDSGMEALVALNFADFGQSPGTPEEIEKRLDLAKESIPKDGTGRVQVGIWGTYAHAEFQAASSAGCRVVLESAGSHNTGEGATTEQPSEFELALHSADKEGLLGDNVTLNHCTSLTEGSWQLIKNNNIKVNICPRSDAQWSLAGGIHAYQPCIQHGIRPGISIDNEISYGADMFTEMKTLFALQRAMVSQGIAKGAPMTVRDLLQAATIDGAACVGRAHEIGSLTPGKWANIVTIRTDDLNLYPVHTAAGTVALAADRSNVDTVIVRGEILKREGKMVNFDHQTFRKIMDESTKHLKAAAGYEANVVSETFSLATS